MTPLAHVGGVPVEELVPAIVVLGGVVGRHVAAYVAMVIRLGREGIS